MKLMTAVAAVVLTLPLLRGADFHLAPGGADSNSGTAQSPWASLAHARDAVRQSGKLGREPVVIYLHGGIYYLPEMFVLTAEDSGTREFPVTYTSAPGEEAVISGGAKLELTWAPFRDGIMMAKTPAGLATDQLFVNGERQPMARYPNFNPNVVIYNGYAADAISPARVAKWADPKGGFIHMMHGAMWGGYQYEITGKNEKGELQYVGGWQNNRGGSFHKQYRMVENIFEELDAPGEWFLNDKSNTLYFLPPAGVDLAKATVEAVRLKHLIEFKGTEQAPVRFVMLKNLTIRHAARTFMENKEPVLMTDWTTYRGGALFFNGAEDCTVQECFIDQVGGNAIFVNNYNRRIAVKSCQIAKAGANGVAFFGDRAAVREAHGWGEKGKPWKEMDRTPGPKTHNYPADCLVDDCLIYLSGRVEKQTSPVAIDISQGITVRHCSIYDVPRAGINIGDGCFGGHVVEFCDVFDTVKETGDHGSFNSWGRDRFWGRPGWSLKALGEADYQATTLLDVVKPNELRNNRWRCDHGWDVDLDDGSSNYHIYNNVFLNGGLKLREGFFRVVENNIMVNNTFHPHVWYEKNAGVFHRNILMGAYRPAAMQHWNGELDYNLFTTENALQEVRTKFKTDEHSIAGDPMFIDAGKGDYRVKDGSPALTIGFKNFPMDQFGVVSPKLRALARTPEIPAYNPQKAGKEKPAPAATVRTGFFMQAKVRSISGLGERSAYGLPGEYGVLLLEVKEDSAAAKAGFLKDDVIVECNGKEVQTVEKLSAMQNELAGKPHVLAVIRKQVRTEIQVK